MSDKDPAGKCEVHSVQVFEKKTWHLMFLPKSVCVVGYLARVAVQSPQPCSSRIAFHPAPLLCPCSSSHFGHLFCPLIPIALVSSDTGLGRVSQRLPKENANEVLQAVLSMCFDLYEDDSGIVPSRPLRHTYSYL